MAQNSVRTSPNPSGPSKGTLIIIQEIFGVNSHIKNVADGFASDGFTAVAPALFDRFKNDVELGYDEEGIKAGLDLVQQADKNRTG